MVGGWRGTAAACSVRPRLRSGLSEGVVPKRDRDENHRGAVRVGKLMALRRTLMSAGTCLLAVVFVLFGCQLAVDNALRKAELSLALGESSEAREHLKWVIRFWPSHAAAQYAMGQAWLADSDYRAAIECFSAVESKASEFEAAQQRLAAALLLDEQLERAELVMQESLKRFPKSVPVRRQLASLLIGQFREREAVEILGSVLSEPGAYAMSDRVALMQDLLAVQFNPPVAEECLKALQGSARRHPEQQSVNAAIAHGLLAIGRTSDATALLDRLLKGETEDCFVLLARCRLSLAAGHLGYALTSLKSLKRMACAGNPYVQCVHLLESEIAEHDGDWRLALDALDRAASARPLDRINLARRARLLQRLGRAEEAKAVYELVHRRAKAELAIWHLLGSIQDRVPTAAGCLRLVELLDEFGNSREAEAWRILAEQVDTAIPGSALEASNETLH